MLFAWLERHRQRINDRLERWTAITPKALLQQRRAQLAQRQQLLSALSPQRWLARGFAILESTSGTVIQSIEQVETDDSLVVRLRDGAVLVEAQATKALGQADGLTP